MKKKTSKPTTLKDVAKQYQNTPVMTDEDVKPVTAKYPERCAFFLSEDELKQLKIKSIEQNMTLSNYIRSLVFGKGK